MSKHEATFEVESKADAYAVRVLTERVHDTFREELRGTDRSDARVNETLREFQTIRDAAREASPGTLTVTYERRDEPLEG